MASLSCRVTKCYTLLNLVQELPQNNNDNTFFFHRSSLRFFANNTWDFPDPIIIYHPGLGPVPLALLATLTREKLYTFVMFSPTEKLACFKIWVVFGSYFPLNTFLFKSLPQELFCLEDANSNKLILRCYHAPGHSKISSRSPKNKAKQEQW